MDKKQLILDAAIKLFVEFGFHGTPTSKIAQEAGVANGTLFHYFPTKDDLVMALYIDIKTRLNEYIEQNAKQEAGFKERVKGQYLASLYWALDHNAEFRFIQLFNASPYHTVLDPVEVDKQTKPILDMLRMGIKDKIIKALPVDLLYTLITSHTYALNQYLAGQEFSKTKQHQYISDTFELLWDMLT